MPPLIPLFMCIGFVAYLLRSERRVEETVSTAIWLPVIWLFTISTKGAAIWLSSVTGIAFDNRANQVFGLGLLFLGVMVLCRRSFNWRSVLAGHPWLVLLVGFMLISTAWSIDPALTFTRWIHQLITIIMLLVVISEKDPRQSAECVVRRFVYLTIPLSIVLIQYFPHEGVVFGRWSGDRSWVGVALQKNGLGRICILATLYLLASFAQSWHRGEGWLSQNRMFTLSKASVLALALYMLILPEGKPSSTSIGAVIVGIAVFGWMYYRSQRGYSPRFAVVGCLIVLLLGFGIAMPLTQGGVGSGATALFGKDATFTGRTKTWAELGAIAMRHPVLGGGFDSFWTPETRELLNMSHGHCSYLEVFNELGCIGLLLFGGFMIAAARNAHRVLAQDPAWGSFALAFIVMALLHGMTESSINSFDSQLAGIVLLLSLSCAAMNCESVSAVDA